MKHIYKILALALLIVIAACSSDDDGQRRLVVTTVSDIEIAISPLGNMLGDTLTEVPGTSSRGSVTFAIVSQSLNVFNITEDTGQLMISDPSLIRQNENTVVQAIVSVTREEITENTNIILTILPVCSDVDISNFLDTSLFAENLLVVNSNSPDNILEAAGSIEGNCDSFLTLTGGDPLALGECFDSVLQIIFLEGNGNTGQVVLERQDYCTGGIEIDGIGTYNLQNGAILIDVNRTENGVTESFGTVTISLRGCPSTVMTSIWSGDLNYEEITIGISEPGTGSAGCGSLTLMGDVGFFECDQGFVPTINYILTPDSPGATSGEITAEPQGYSCFDGSETLSYQATGTYDEITGEIELNYEFSENGDPSFLSGITIVTAN